MVSKLYPHKMKESAIFWRSNSTNFHPPLNRHVPAAWLPKADGVNVQGQFEVWKQVFTVSKDNRGRVTRQKQVTSNSQLEGAGEPYEAKFSYGFEHVFRKMFRSFNGGKSLCCSVV